jgi:hypothetical protein
MAGQAAHKDDETDHVGEVSKGSCYRMSSLHVWCAGMAGQAVHEDDAAPVDTDHVREVSIGSCYRKSSLHVWCAGMAGQAAHEDDAAPVEADHGGQELSQTPHLTHQVHLPRIIVIILAKKAQ